MAMEKSKAQIFIAALALIMLSAYFVWSFFFRAAKTVEPKFEERFVSIPQIFEPIPGITSFKFATSSIAFFPELYQQEDERQEELELEELEMPVSEQTEIPPSPQMPFSPSAGLETELMEIETMEAAPTTTSREIQEREISVFADGPIARDLGYQLAMPEEEIILSLTPEQFTALYPDYFIEIIQQAQDLIKIYDPNYQKLAKIETDFEVRRVQEKFITLLFSGGSLTKEEAETYLVTLRYTLPKLQLMELEFSQAKKNIFLSFLSWPKLPAMPVCGGLVKKLQQLFIPVAEAGPCGYCYTSPVCFTPGVGAPLPGINTWAGFCYCTGCYHGLGCLDRCAWEPAIWDPMTGICGCG
ncbi:MAG: hypothetical protein COV00_03055 [Candidatus Tagabacteria bacterium CG10_big_fil_rev_8_21_14_0_10_40_13]|uniref:Uncharacterized protein n=1 Tax=Candidatus Tagabacteria bacterium CG10_big_fil_rev_8_21_14_0_10_40_13 TaxID=1975022 RepID=A0A2M8L8B2_9BACT|nr:MAG: hypothetical protein COV00_03055 [Candidatus Tagabacteria bacterium CG10_big_fil_rev_8_21_14_0_10_40_13]